MHQTKCLPNFSLPGPVVPKPKMYPCPHVKMRGCHLRELRLWAFFCRESCTIFGPQIPKPQISKCTSTYSDRNRLNLNAFESDARLAGLAAATPQWRRSLPKFTGGLESVLSERHAQRCGFPQCRMLRMHVLAGSAEPRHCAFLLWR